MAFTMKVAEVISADKTGLLSKHASWERVKLSAVARILNGAPFDSAYFSATDGMPLVRIRDVISGQTSTYYSGPFDDVYRVQRGDLLVGMDGDFNSGEWQSDAALLNQRVCKISTDDRFYEKRFLGYLLPGYLKAINDNTPSVTVKHLSSKTIGDIDLPLPPRKEQTRIVEKLEELLSDLDAGVAELKAAQRKLGQYRQSLLKAAVEGALTASWRAQHTPTETGAQLLERILTERRARWEAQQLAKFEAQGKAPPKDWRKKYPEPMRPDIQSLQKLPHGWAWASFDEITSFVTSGSRGWADYYSNSGAVFIRSQDINRDFLNLSDTAFVNPPPSSEGARTLVRQNDVLLTVTGANVGKSAIVSMSLPEAYVSQHVALIRLIDTDLSNFAHLFLTADSGGRGKLLKTAYGAGKPGLNLQQIAALPIPVAGKEELAEVGNILSSQFNAISQQQAAIELALKQSAAQRKNILKAAFSGQLVPQDPGDEPAAVLLERIRAQKDRQTRKTRGQPPGAVA